MDSFICRDSFWTLDAGIVHTLSLNIYTAPLLGYVCWFFIRFSNCDKDNADSNGIIILLSVFPMNIKDACPKN